MEPRSGKALVGLVVSTFLTTSLYCSFVTVRLPIITLWTMLGGVRQSLRR